MKYLFDLSMDACLVDLLISCSSRIKIPTHNMHNRAMNTSEVTDTAMTLEISTVLIVAIIQI